MYLRISNDCAFRTISCGKLGSTYIFLEKKGLATRISRKETTDQLHS